ncbi:hypothetical protein DES40_2285 [Litorimonas taeanensis]|uniref:PEGA domain-containing protein n=1 Tax=Litorimonas taeanensis TaxID=568099 RepID=A0A420WES4_9PROT|nr:hypothetical protein [Litorimonas taeanensis]RKQ69484.1 hypothetical protein DES40_2285 [Litorimonas taeanensis]
MNYKLVLATIIAFQLPACSTVMNGSNQLVKFTTGDVIGADCTATGGSDFAVNEKFTTPAEVKIPRSKKTLKVECNKEGYEVATKNIVGRIEGSTGGNILLGGPIGVGVDALSGAIYKYPDTILIPMDELNPSSDLTSPKMP